MPQKSPRQNSSPIHTTLWIMAGIAFIIMLTLYPFRFEAIVWGKKDAIKEFFRNSSDWFDFCGNILLFVPFGYGLSQAFASKRSPIFLRLGFILGISLSLTVLIETLQLFLPERSSSAIDIFTNTLGGTIGGAFGLFHWHRFVKVGRHWVAQQWSKPRLLTIILGLWIVLMFGITEKLAHMVALDKWNPAYNLVTGCDDHENGWQGQVQGISFTDRALSKTEAQQFLKSPQFPTLVSSLADYDLTGSPPYRDRSRLALPLLEPQSIENLVPHHQQATPEPDKTPQIRDWYQTQQPPIALTEAIRKTSAFTLATTFETHDLDNLGRGLILALSLDENQRNLSLEQHKREIITRIKTSATGGNGRAIELKAQSLELNRSHRVMITYQDAVLSLYLDDTELNQITLRPELIFFRFLMPNIRGRNIPINPLALSLYPFSFYAIWFIPVGTLLGRIVLLMRSDHLKQSRSLLSLSDTLIVGLTVGLSSLAMSFVLSTFSSKPLEIGLTCFGLALLPIGIQLIHPILKLR